MKATGIVRRIDDLGRVVNQGVSAPIRTLGVECIPLFRVLFALGTFVSAVVGGGSFGNGENPCAATDFGRTDRY